MSSPRALVVANWKMNASVAFVERFAAAWREPPPHVDAVVCPPFGYLGHLVEALRGRTVRFGVQDIAAQPPGAFTGDHECAGGGHVAPDDFDAAQTLA